MLVDVIVSKRECVKIEKPVPFYYAGLCSRCNADVVYRGVVRLPDVSPQLNGRYCHLHINLCEDCYQQLAE